MHSLLASSAPRPLPVPMPRVPREPVRLLLRALRASVRLLLRALLASVRLLSRALRVFVSLLPRACRPARLPLRPMPCASAPAARAHCAQPARPAKLATSVTIQILYRDSPSSPLPSHNTPLLYCDTASQASQPAIQ